MAPLSEKARQAVLHRHAELCASVVGVEPILGLESEAVKIATEVRRKQQSLVLFQLSCCSVNPAALVRYSRLIESVFRSLRLVRGQSMIARRRQAQ